jgi:CubicO group peptidase (beta-lactamase class C family)
MTNKDVPQNDTERIDRRSLLRRTGVAAGAGAALLGAGGTVWATMDEKADSRPGRVRIPKSLRPGGELDNLIEQLALEDKFSGTVLLVHRDREVLARSYGMSNTETSIANGRETIFNLGSITKLFTATAVSQLVEQEKLAYRDRIGDYLDGFGSEVADSVTVHHLLTHTSGLGDFFRQEYFEEAATWTSPEQVFDGTLQYVRELPLDFQPGARHQYSNAAFMALGAIVAKVSGQSYYDYVREHVFARAGMDTADFYTTPKWKADTRIAHPYATEPSGERVDAIDRHGYIPLPPGGSHASAADLMAFARALNRNRLMGGVQTHFMLSPKIPVMGMGRPPGPGTSDEHPPPGGPMPPPHQAYGPLLFVRNGQIILGHNGGSPGVSTNLDWFPASEWTAVVLSNYDGAAGPIAEKCRELITENTKGRS